jgi:hypothetical protein
MGEYRAYFFKEDGHLVQRAYRLNAATIPLPRKCGDAHSSSRHQSEKETRAHSLCASSSRASVLGRSRRATQKRLRQPSLSGVRCHFQTKLFSMAQCNPDRKCGIREREKAPASGAETLLGLMHRAGGMRHRFNPPLSRSQRPVPFRTGPLSAPTRSRPLSMRYKGRRDGMFLRAMGSIGTGAAAETLHNIVLERFRR